MIQYSLESRHFMAIFAGIYGQNMLNCLLLLDSASRFGLKDGTCKFPCDAKKTHFLVSLFGVCACFVAK